MPSALAMAVACRELTTTCAFDCRLLATTYWRGGRSLLPTGQSRSKAAALGEHLMSDGKFRPLDPNSQECPTEFLLFNFGIGSPALKPAHERFLRQGILLILKTNGDHKVRLVGRASRSGPDSFDLKLSRQRADAVGQLAQGPAHARRHAPSLGSARCIRDSSQAQRRSTGHHEHIVLLRKLSTVGNSSRPSVGVTAALLPKCII